MHVQKNAASIVPKAENKRMGAGAGWSTIATAQHHQKTEIDALWKCHKKHRVEGNEHGRTDCSRARGRDKDHSGMPTSSAGRGYMQGSWGI